MLWRCWLGSRKGIWPVKKWAVGCWCGYLSSVVQACIWPSWCHCHSLSLVSVKSRLVLPFWYQLTLVVPDKRPLNGCVSITMNDLKTRQAPADVWREMRGRWAVYRTSWQWWHRGCECRCCLKWQCTEDTDRRRVQSPVHKRDCHLRGHTQCRSPFSSLPATVRCGRLTPRYV